MKYKYQAMINDIVWYWEEGLKSDDEARLVYYSYGLLAAKQYLEQLRDQPEVDKRFEAIKKLINSDTSISVLKEVVNKL